LNILQLLGSFYAIIFIFQIAEGDFSYGITSFLTIISAIGAATLSFSGGIIFLLAKKTKTEMDIDSISVVGYITLATLAIEELGFIIGYSVGINYGFLIIFPSILALLMLFISSLPFYLIKQMIKNENYKLPVLGKLIQTNSENAQKQGYLFFIQWCGLQMLVNS
jgi:uncharacterized membrane protein